MKAMLELTARTTDLEAEDAALSCPHCEQVLNLHQPDESMPNQLLATCDSCQRWYMLFSTGEDSSQFLMLDLPDKPALEQAELMDGLEG
jgi:hypothetical protein